MTDLADGITALLAEPLDTTVQHQLLDRLLEEADNPPATALALVRCYPQSDGPRLVYALWCELHGQSERAEFIRVQCELARTPEPEEVTIFRYDGSTTCEACMRVRGGSGLCRYHELQRRERELWEELSEAFIAELRPLGLWSEGKNCSTGPGSGWPVLLTGCDSRFARGFLSHVTCTAADWLAHGDAITARHPVERVTLTTMPPTTRHIATAIQFRVLPAEWTACGEPLAIDSDDQLLAELRRKWEGITFELLQQAYDALSADENDEDGTDLDE